MHHQHTCLHPHGATQPPAHYQDAYDVHRRHAGIVARRMEVVLAWSHCPESRVPGALSPKLLTYAVARLVLTTSMVLVMIAIAAASRVRFVGSTRGARRQVMALGRLALRAVERIIAPGEPCTPPARRADRRRLGRVWTWATRGNGWRPVSPGRTVAWLQPGAKATLRAVGRATPGVSTRALRGAMTYQWPAADLVDVVPFITALARVVDTTVREDPDHGVAGVASAWFVPQAVCWTDAYRRGRPWGERVAAAVSAARFALAVERVIRDAARANGPATRPAMAVLREFSASGEAIQLDMTDADVHRLALAKLCPDTGPRP